MPRARGTLGGGHSTVPRPRGTPGWRSQHVPRPRGTLGLRTQHVPRPGSEETGAGARSGAAQGKAGLPARIIQPQRAFFPEMAEAASDRSQQEGWGGAGCVCTSTARRAKRADTAARMRKLQAWGRAADRGAANGSVGVINAPEQKLTEGDGRAGYGR